MLVSEEVGFFFWVLGKGGFEGFFFTWVSLMDGERISAC
jgi:hypothetical protein